MYYYYSYCCLCHYCITMTIIIIITVKSLLIQHLLNIKQSVFKVQNLFPLNSQDLISNSPYFLPYSSCDVSLENLVLDQLIIP